MAKTLIYETTPRPFSTPEGEPEHSELVGHFRLDERAIPGDPRRYQLRISADVETREEAEARHPEALALADDLNLVWTYVAGEPLFATHAVLAIRDSPEGWTTNYKEVRRQLPSKACITYDDIRIETRFGGIPLPFMPLLRAVAALRAYRSADENTRLLIALHHDAIRHRSTQAGLFLLAKALELARLMLPGSTDNARQKTLPADLQSEFRQSLHWLFDIANNRLEIRHVLGRKALLPRLKNTERTQFTEDADLVIRGVVERELGIPNVIVRAR